MQSQLSDYLSFIDFEPARLRAINFFLWKDLTRESLSCDPEKEVEFSSWIKSNIADGMPIDFAVELLEELFNLTAAESRILTTIIENYKSEQ